MLREASSLLEISASAKRRIDGAGDNHSPRGTLLIDTSGATEALDGRQLIAVGRVLAVNSSDLVAQAGEQGLGDGVAGGGPVELEDADMPAVGRWQVGDADQRLGRGRVQAPQRAEGRGEGKEAWRHGGQLELAQMLGWFVVLRRCEEKSIAKPSLEE